MTRAEHIERLKAIREYCCAKKDRASLDFAIQSLEIDEAYQIEYEKKAGWIPLSKKWPPLETEVITSDDHDNLDIMTLYYDEGEEGGYGFEDTYGNIHEVDTIAAWIPAPEHFKGEENNG